MLSEVFDVVPRSAIALELASVAPGVVDGFVHVGGSPVQDFAPGVLLDGRPSVWDSSVVIAGAPATHADLGRRLRGLERPNA